MFSRIQYISQGTTPQKHLAGIKAALDSGVEWIQLRMKDCSVAEICSIGQQVASCCAAYKACFILNDYLDLVPEIGAAGVHLGLKDSGIPAARSKLGNRAIIGGTANCYEDVWRRNIEGCDYIGLGPLRYTPTKAHLSPILGVAGYQHIFRQLASLEKQNIAQRLCPIYAIGGIRPQDILALRRIGVFGVALSGYLTNSDKDQSSLKAGTIGNANLTEKIQQLKKLLYV